MQFRLRLGVQVLTLIGCTFCRVIRVQKDSIIVACLQDIKPGDGVVFETGRMEHEEPGGTVMKVVEPSKQLLRGERKLLEDLQKQSKTQYRILQLVVRSVDTRKVRIDHLVWRTKQEGLLAGIRQSYEGTSAVEKRRIAVDAVLSGMVGERMMLTLSVRCCLFRHRVLLHILPSSSLHMRTMGQGNHLHVLQFSPEGHSENHKSKDRGGYALCRTSMGIVALQQGQTS